MIFKLGRALCRHHLCFQGFMWNFNIFMFYVLFYMLHPIFGSFVQCVKFTFHRFSNKVGFELQKKFVHSTTVISEWSKKLLISSLRLLEMKLHWGIQLWRVLLLWCSRLLTHVIFFCVVLWLHLLQLFDFVKHNVLIFHTIFNCPEVFQVQLWSGSGPESAIKQYNETIVRHEISGKGSGRLSAQTWGKVCVFGFFIVN